MAPLRIDVDDGGDTSVVIKASFDPWRSWAPIDTPAGQPVHKVAAVARLDTADLFVLADDRTVYTRPFRNGFWRDWTQLGGAAFLPTAGLAAATSSVDTIDVFVIGDDDRVWTMHCGPAGWDDHWVHLDTPGLDQSASLAATPTSHDHVELFATDPERRIVHWTVTGQVADGLEGLPPLPPVNTVAANTLGDGSVQLHAVTDGPGDGRLWSTRDQHGLWDPWFNHGQTPLDPQAELASVTEGAGTAFVIGAHTPLQVREFSGGWIGPAIGVDGLELQPYCSLAAISRDLRSIDVFAVRPDGTLAAITRSPEVGAALIGAQSQRNYPALIVHNDAWFVSAQPLFLLNTQLTLWANTQVPGPAERFTIHELQRITETVGDQELVKTMVAIEAVNGRYLTAEKGGNNIVFARGDAVGDWEKWRLFPYPAIPTPPSSSRSTATTSAPTAMAAAWSWPRVNARLPGSGSPSRDREWQLPRDRFAGVGSRQTLGARRSAGPKGRFAERSSPEQGRPPAPVTRSVSRPQRGTSGLLSPPSVPAIPAVETLRRVPPRVRESAGSGPPLSSTSPLQKRRRPALALPPRRSARRRAIPFAPERT